MTATLDAYNQVITRLTEQHSELRLDNALAKDALKFFGEFYLVYNGTKEDAARAGFLLETVRAAYRRSTTVPFQFIILKLFAEADSAVVELFSTDKTAGLLAGLEVSLGMVLNGGTFTAQTTLRAEEIKEHLPALLPVVRAKWLPSAAAAAAAVSQPPM